MQDFPARTVLISSFNCPETLLAKHFQGICDIILPNTFAAMANFMKTLRCFLIRFNFHAFAVQQQGLPIDRRSLFTVLYKMVVDL